MKETQQIDQQPVETARKPYSSPELEEHGSVETLTQQKIPAATADQPQGTIDADLAP